MTITPITSAKNDKFNADSIKSEIMRILQSTK